MLARLLGSNTAPALANDGHQLAFMLHLLGLRREDDGITGVDDRGRRFHKDQRYFGDFVAQFLGVFGIVAAYTDNLARFGRREEFDICQQRFGRQAAIFTVDITLDNPDLILVDPAVTGGFIFDLIADDAHGCL